jgi:flagellar basal body-associated protein FliL
METIKKYALYIVILIVVLVLMGGAGYMLGLRAGSKSASDSVSRTVQQLNADNAAARAEIERANEIITELKSQLGAAGVTADTISTGLSKAQDRATEISDINKQCLIIIGQCQQDNDKAKSILNDVKPTNQKGTTTSSASAN